MLYILLSIMLLIGLLSCSSTTSGYHQVLFPLCELNMYGTGPAKTPCYLNINDAGGVIYRTNDGQLGMFYTDIGK